MNDRQKALLEYIRLVFPDVKKAITTADFFTKLTNYVFEDASFLAKGVGYAIARGIVEKKTKQGMDAFEYMINNFFQKLGQQTRFRR